MLLQILSLLLALVATQILWKRWKYDLHKIPSPPGWVPYLGHAYELLRDGGRTEFSQLRGNWFKKLGYPKIMKVQFKTQTLVYVRDMECAKSVVLSKTNPFPKEGMTRGGLIRMMGNDTTAQGLLGTPGVTPYAKAVRRVYANAFTSAMLKKHLPKVNGVLDKMIEIVEAKRESGAIDFQKLCVKMTLDTIGVVAFDMPLGGLDESREMYQLLIDVGRMGRIEIFKPFLKLYRKLFPSPKENTRQEKIDQLTAEWDKITEEIAKRDDPPDVEMPFWHAMKTLVNPETGKQLSYKELCAELATAVVGGTDTTGHQLGWILALLASNSRVVDTMLKELSDHGLCGADARDVTFEDLGELTYLTAVIKEGMRIATAIVGVIWRIVPQDMTIMGYRIPKGTTVTVPGNRWLNTESEWGDPEVFRPERWLTEEDINQKYFFVFSYGPRDCVGQRLAMMELRLAVIKLVSKYTFKMDISFEELINNCRNGFAIEARDGVWLHVALRSIHT